MPKFSCMEFDAAGVRVKAWRVPNEDGVIRAHVLLHTQWDGSLSLTPLRKPACLRCYPRCFQEMDHAR